MMKNQIDQIRDWERFFSDKERVFPAEGLIRVLKGTYPRLSKINHIRKSKALDQGCGDGRNSELLKSLGYQVYGVDVSEQMVNNNQKKFPGITFKLGFNRSIPFENNFFDLLVGWNSIYYLSEPEDDLKDNLLELARVAKNNALVILSIPTPENFIFKKSHKLKSSANSDIYYFKIHSDYFAIRNNSVMATFRSKESLKKVLKTTGFSQIEVSETFGDWFGLNYCWWTIVCRKKS
jgi:ubiquinone/menaquinone biosynthesis C-methylase UbiE